MSAGAAGDPSGITLRVATAADVERLRALVQAAYGHYVERIGGRPRPLDDDYTAIVRAGRATVAERDGVIAGLIVLDRATDGMWVDNVAVDPAYQSAGVGRALLEHAETVARREGFGEMRLLTHELMTENRALYGRIGYTETDRPDHGRGRLVYFRKPL